MKIDPESRAFIVLLGALTAVNALSIDMSLPALPTLARVFATPADTVQLTLSLYVIGYAVGQLIYGPLSDRYGRRPILLAGLLLYAAAGIACAAATSIEMLIAARVVQGFAACVGPVIGRAIVRDHFGGKRAAQILSSLVAVFAVAPLVAPVIGGALLGTFGWASIFVFLTAWAVVLLVTMWLTLGESLAKPDLTALQVGRLLANYSAFLTNRTCFGYALLNGVCWSGTFLFLSATPFVLIDVYGVAPANFGYYFSASAITLIFGALANRRLLRRYPLSRVLRIGFTVLLAGSLVVLAGCVAPWGGPITICGGFALYIFGAGLVQPNAMASALEPLPHMAGMASALIGGIQMICGSIGGYAVNALYDGTAAPLGEAFLASTLATIALYVLVLRRWPIPA